MAITGYGPGFREDRFFTFWNRMGKSYGTRYEIYPLV
jgi:hypothetical protein